MYTSPVDLFYNLTPDLALKSIEKQGFKLSGRYTQLNSYENRVFSVELEEEHLDLGREIIAKFYRPRRWSKQAIQDEHDFLYELSAAGIPAVAPIKLPQKNSIFESGSIFSCLFPKAKGRLPYELNTKQLKQIGTMLARLHNVGEQKKALFRPTLSTENYGDNALKILENFVPYELQKKYFEAANEILDFLDEILVPENFIRIHGDCHKGNLLQTDPIKGPKEYFMVDFDDFCNGPPVQDFWMLLSGDNDLKELNALLEGYTQLRHFDSKSFSWIPALRGLRVIYYSSWIAMRWKDPSFPKIFENFTTYNYWLSEVESLERLLHQVHQLN